MLFTMVLLHFSRFGGWRRVGGKMAEARLPMGSLSCNNARSHGASARKPRTLHTLQRFHKWPEQLK